MSDDNDFAASYQDSNTPEIALLEKWLEDLKAIVAEQDMLNDPEIIRKVSLMEIELEGAKLNLPESDRALSQLILAKHQAQISDGILIVLQDVLGYYTLPARTKGENEPILGSAMAHDLKTQLYAQYIDVFAIKHQLVQLLEATKD